MRYLSILTLFLVFGVLRISAQTDTLIMSEVDTINGFYIPKSLEDSFKELDKLLPDSIRQEFVKANEDEVVNGSHFGLGMWVRNNWGLWIDSRLAVFFNTKGIVHPDDMSSLILTCYHRYQNGRSLNFEELIQSYLEYWLELERQEKERELIMKGYLAESLNWLKENRIPLNKLPKADSSNFIYNCDSVLLLKQTSEIEDTITIWAVGMESYMDTIRLKEWMQSDKFGKTSYVSEINSQGKFVVFSLSPKTFHIRNDSLFELETFYKITQDSLFELYKEMTDVIPDSIEMAQIREKINSNIYQTFKLIFHPTLFDEEGLYDENVNGDIIELMNSWQIDGKSYYKIRVKNYIGMYDSEYFYIFDDEYKFLEYDGCNQRELSQLVEKKE